MTTSIWPITLFPRRPRRKTRYKPTENTEAHSWIFQEEMCEDENIWNWKAQALHFPTINHKLSTGQASSNQKSSAYMHTSKFIWDETTDRFVGFFLPPCPSISLTQLAESTSLERSKDFNPYCTTTFQLPSEGINSEQRWRQQLLSYSVTSPDRWRLK